MLSFRLPMPSDSPLIAPRGSALALSRPTKILILANPTAGAGAVRANRARILKAVQRDLEKRGHSVHIGLETEPRAIRERAQNAACAGTPVVVAAGGDGTINAVVNGLMRASGGGHSRTKLGVLPLGTGNVFAYNLGLSNWRVAARALGGGHSRRIDVGHARPLEEAKRGRKKGAAPLEAARDKPSPRYFVLMSGIGFDAKVIEETSLRLKWVLRDFAYALTSLQNAVVHQGTQVTLTFPDGTRHSEMAWLLMAGNAASYAWAIKFTGRARMDDGKLDLCVFPFENKLTSVQQVTQLLLGQHVERGTARYYQTPSVKIESSPPIPIQLDGDEWGTTPAELVMLPGVLDVLVPEV